jgi:hypothetical protein
MARQISFTKTQSPFVSVKKIPTGAWLASVRKRVSLSRNATSADFRAVMSRVAPTMRTARPSSRTTTAFVNNHTMPPLGRTARNSSSYGVSCSSELWIARCTGARSSGCTRVAKAPPVPANCSRVTPWIA